MFKQFFKRFWSLKPYLKWIVGLLFIAIVWGVWLLVKPEPVIEEPTLALPAEVLQDLEERKAEWLNRLKEFPDYYEAYLDLGNIESRLGHYQQAIKYYQRASEIVPSSSIPLLNVSEVYLKQNNFQAAEKALLKAQSTSADFPLVYDKLADFYDKYTNDVDKAVAAYELGLDNLERPTSLLKTLANYLDNRNRLADAKRYYQEILSREPNNQEILSKLKNVESRLGQ